MARPQKILLFALDFLGWEQARPWSYAAGLALEEGFAAAGAEFITVPTFGNLPTNSPLAWSEHVKRLLAGQTFDQVWLWLVHVNYDDSFWEWVKTIAPVRVGFITESLTYDEELCKEDARFAKRAAFVESQLAHCTHAIVVDEVDELALERKGIPSFWWPPTIPSRLIPKDIALPRHNLAAFYGTLYPVRTRWLNRANLGNKLIFPIPPENARKLPEKFEQTNRSMLTFLQHAVPVGTYYLNQHASLLRQVRREIFDLWIEALKLTTAVVNLPTMGKMFASRVGEVMGAGRVMIAWNVPERPRQQALFEPDKEILFYSAERPEELAGQIDRVLRDQDFAMKVSAAARDVMLAKHTIEARVKAALAWIK